LNGTNRQIHLISLIGQPSRPITLKDWNNLLSLDWAADGKGFFISTNPTGHLSAPLYVDLAGSTHSLWQQKTFKPAGESLRTMASMLPLPSQPQSATPGWWKIFEGGLVAVILFA